MEMAQMGASGKVRMYQKRPNKMRMEFEMMGMVVAQGFDGKTAWGVNPQTGQIHELPEGATKAFERQALGPESILNPEMYGIKYTYEGKEKVQDKDSLVLEQTFSDGYQSTLYVDAESYLLIMVKAVDLNQTGAEVVSETYYSDYREVEGVSTPYKISVFQDGQESMQVTITDVVFNGGLGDSTFTILH
jgi:outer membrane lipoprotein-sorting protein